MTATIVRDTACSLRASLTLATLLRHVLLVAVMLVSVASHGTAMAWDPEANATGPASHAHALYPDDAGHCDRGGHCPAAQPAPCCVIGHCLSGILAASGPALPALPAASPEAAEFGATAASPQGPPERPPRRA